MNINDNELKLFEAIFWEKNDRIREKFDAEDKQIQFSANVSTKLPRHYDWVKKFAKEVISARVESYIEIYQRIEKFPEEKDFQEIGEDLHKIAKGFVNSLPKYYEGPFSSYPESHIKLLKEQLVLELQQIAGSSLSPIHRLVMEGKVIKKENNKMVIPIEIQNSLAKFRKDYPENTKTAFIMMRFGGQTHDEITKAIREVLFENNIVGLRADDKQYHDDLYSNILTFIYGCDFGISIFERIETNEFNPNIAFETGYMFALGKDVCLLKDRTLTSLHTDIVGKLYKPFDTRNIKSTISQELFKWLTDKEVV